jgi:TetR/AcrR family transcriptional regulator, cholesterol catabolism regulator
MREIATTIKKPELVVRRRKQIVSAAIELFRRNGYHRTTVREICDTSKVNRGSFYDYFQSKEDILVYIYKTMMYAEGNFDKAFKHYEMTGWKDLEPYVRAVLSVSWNINKRSIQLLYRETISLDQNTLQEVIRIESDYVKWIAENLRKGLGLRRVTRELEIFSNMLVFFNSFIPLRGWNMRHLKQADIMNVLVEMIMLKLKQLKKAAVSSKTIQK